MKNEVNRAIVAKKKKMYESPLSEVLPVSPATMVMVGGSPTTPIEPAPRRREKSVF